MAKIATGMQSCRDEGREKVEKAMAMAMVMAEGQVVSLPVNV